MVKATLAGVIAVLTPGQSIPVTVQDTVNPMDANKFYVDADNANDGFYGSILTL